eukprot:CAMPEP_0180266910 /NCGR_PEP_ID=MMETSP0988-20121125/1257_1 /TAXON_ID=697907 /ORGANISM="non described non described, Strain CCMP2293" /LENGTH=311 /DNA_ID=CAMNT_0022237533 /DNA_START=81 /DNA_END=1016 /DNA_ORIENTATION=-
MPANATLLSKGDNIVNTIRYLQRCEHFREDVRLVEQSMMTYTWFSEMHAPHLPGVVFPGTYRAMFNTDSHGYTMRDFLDANVRKGKKKGERRDVFVCGGWRLAPGNGEAAAFGGVAGYRTLPGGVCERVVRESDFYKAKLDRLRRDHQVLGIPDRASRNTVHLSGKAAAKYDARSWEFSVNLHTQQALMRYAHYLVMRAQHDGDNVPLHEEAQRVFAYALEDWPEEGIAKAATLYRLAAIGCSRLLNAKATAKNLSDTSSMQTADCNNEFIVNNLNRFIELEKVFPVEVEKKIVAAFLQHKHAFIDVKLDG